MIQTKVYKPALPVGKRYVLVTLSPMWAKIHWLIIVVPAQTAQNTLSSQKKMISVMSIHTADFSVKEHNMFPVFSHFQCRFAGLFLALSWAIPERKTHKNCLIVYRMKGKITEFSDNLIPPKVSFPTTIYVVNLGSLVNVFPKFTIISTMFLASVGPILFRRFSTMCKLICGDGFGGFKQFNPMYVSANYAFFSADK